VPLLTAELKKHSKDELVAMMEKQSVPGGPINTLPDIFASEQVAAREMQISMENDKVESGKVDLIGNPVKFSKTPVTYRKPPPACGQHTDEILDELLKG